MGIHNSPPDCAEVLRAYENLQNAIRFLRGGKDDVFCLAEPTLSFASGALCALGWALGRTPDECFARYLTALRRIEPRLISEARDE